MYTLKSITTQSDGWHLEFIPHKESVHVCVKYDGICSLLSALNEIVGANVDMIDLEFRRIPDNQFRMSINGSCLKSDWINCCKLEGDNV